VQSSPGRLIAAQTEYALKPQSAGAVLLARHEPYRLKPNPQGRASALKHGSRRNRDLTTALAAMQIAPRGNPGRRLAPTPKAFISLWPTDARNVTPAGRLIGKPPIELLEIPGISRSYPLSGSRLPRGGGAGEMTRGPGPLEVEAAAGLARVRDPRRIHKPLRPDQPHPDRKTPGPRSTPVSPDPIHPGPYGRPIRPVP
jgi:hypothetical protein